MASPGLGGDLVSGDALEARWQTDDGADRGQGSVASDGELVDGAVPARLGVEVAAARGEVDRAGVRGGRDRLQQRWLAGRVDREGAQVVRARVRDEVEVADTQDPAERGLAVALRLRIAQGAARVDRVRRDRARPGLAVHEPAEG